MNFSSSISYTFVFLKASFEIFSYLPTFKNQLTHGNILKLLINSVQYETMMINNSLYLYYTPTTKTQYSEGIPNYKV